MFLKHVDALLFARRQVKLVDIEAQSITTILYQIRHFTSIKTHGKLLFKTPLIAHFSKTEPFSQLPRRRGIKGIRHLLGHLPNINVCLCKNLLCRNPFVFHDLPLNKINKSNKTAKDKSL